MKTDFYYVRVTAYAVPFDHGHRDAGCHLGGGEPAEASWPQGMARPRRYFFGTDAD